VRDKSPRRSSSGRRLDDNGWPVGFAGGAEASFVQEGGGVNPLPGSPFSISEPQGADNDYYFAGQYFTVIPANGEYDPVGAVDVDEEAAERAFTDTDLEQRYPSPSRESAAHKPALRTFRHVQTWNTSGADPRFGVEVYFNGVLVQPQIVIRPPQIDVDYTTPQFTLASVNAEVGPGTDNIVTLRGTAYTGSGGGAWMGIDYVQLNQETTAIPSPAYPWGVGRDDGAWTAGTGGGTNATFALGTGTVNALPGSATSTDNDYYLAGVYTNAIAANGTYEPVGLVGANEAAAEGGFTGNDTELRYHFNLPNTLQPTDLMAVTFDAFGLDTTGADPRYGVEV